MIGWFISVYSPLEPKGLPSFDSPLERTPLMRWSTGLEGLRWIEAICATPNGTFLGGDGYPFKYAIRAADAKPVLTASPTALYWKEFVSSPLPESGGEGLRDSLKLESVNDDRWLVFVVFDQS